MNGESLWPRLAELPLVIEACRYDRLHAVLAHESERITTHVRLAGEGTDGLGEDISILREDGTALHETRPSLGLEGEWTLAGFCDHLATLELWPEPPEWEGALRFRNWAFESAALDLALATAARCTTCSAGAAAGALRQLARPRQGAVVRASAPAARPLPRRALQARREATWAPALVDQVAATGAVDTIDDGGRRLPDRRRGEPSGAAGVAGGHDRHRGR